MMTLDGRGMVRGCNQSGEELFKYCLNELAGRHISIAIPQLSSFEMMQNDQINQSLKYLCRIGFKFCAVTKDDKNFTCELFLNLLDSRTESRLSLIIVPAD